MTAANRWSGLFLINKPQDVTSFSVVAQLRRFTGIRKVGHTGTLDPFAQGLLLVCCGKATITAAYLEALDKTYLAKVVFGSSTDTQDLTGQVVKTHQFSAGEKANITQDDFALLRRQLKAMQGEISQLPPMYSAVKVKGTPLYKYARRGETVARKERIVQIHQAELVSAAIQDHLEAEIRIVCSRGTYIRTFADELGQKLGTYAHAAALTRLACGKYNIEQSIKPDELFLLQEKMSGQDLLRDYLRQQGIFIPLDEIFLDSYKIQLTRRQSEQLIWGQKLLVNRSEIEKPLLSKPEDRPLAFYYRQQLVALGRLVQEDAENYRLKTERVVKDIADIQ